MKESKCFDCGASLRPDEGAECSHGHTICHKCSSSQGDILGELLEKSAKDLAILKDNAFLKALSKACEELSSGSLGPPWGASILSPDNVLQTRKMVSKWPLDIPLEEPKLCTITSVIPELDYLEDTTKQFPHCDQRVLHEPGECEFCDRHPEWQFERARKNVNFTGKTERKHPCPADEARGLAGAHVWGGNTPKKAGDKSSWVAEYQHGVASIECTCGADSVKSPHSDWCDKYEK